MSDAQINFVKQQGFEDASRSTCDVRYPALMFQPRLIGALAVAGVFFQSATLFLTLAAILWWNALVPSLNPFDKLYNALIAARRGLPLLTAAPAPRRFSQGMAGTFTLAIGASLLAGWTTVAWAVEAMLLFALGALIFGRFCLGSFIFHLLIGNRAFAMRTLPWARRV
jgi:hypothetical protein